MKVLAKVFFVLTLAALCSCVRLLAQNKADSLRLAYDFHSAVELCEREISQVQDSIELMKWDSSLVLARNGLSMVEYCYEPDVVAKVNLNIKNFFLFYPMDNGKWYHLPNQLDSAAAEKFIRAVFVPDESQKEIFFSHQDSLGKRNIYETHLLDSLWSYPDEIFEDITESSNEIYPTLSPDGNTLFFASDGLYGMGGYDLYSSEWDEEEQKWGMPVNLGFPFSSPYDDFLFYNTPDGKYTIFASNRETAKDSVCVYVLDYDSTPIRRSIGDIARLREISSLNPKNSARLDNTAALSNNTVENEAVKQYSSQVNLVKSLRDSLYRFHDKIDVLEMQARLNDAVKTLQRLELEFLSSGQSFDLSTLQKESQKEVVGAESGYTFSKNELGTNFSMIFQDSAEEIEEEDSGEIETEEEETPKAKTSAGRRIRSSQPSEVVRYMLIIIPEDGRALPSSAIAVIRQQTDKDIIRHSEEGVVTFEVGLFEDRSAIESLIDLLEENGAPDCSIEEETVKLDTI